MTNGLTVASVTEAVGGHLLAGEGTSPVAGVSIDSRSTRPGELFFAIVAARNGHRFVGEALAQGAVGAVIEAAEAPAVRGTADAAALIAVPETTRALQDLARHVRRQSGARVIAITGSAGKTTTKEAIAAVLSARFRVVRNRGNLNNHLGLPLSLLQLGQEDADVAVMELGMNHAGEIRVLVDVAEPDIRVWTNVGDAHIGYFGSVEAVADAKAEILEAADARTVLVCNADDERISRRRAGFPGRTVTFGERADADVRAVSVEDRGLDGTRARVETPVGSVDVVLPLIGRGNLLNALCAVAVGVELAVPLEEIAARIATLQPASRRGAVARLGSGVTVIDDSYNASPAATVQALRVLGSDRTATRKAAVLGEMLELGDAAEELHASVGHAAGAIGLARLFTVGGDPARTLGDEAVAAGLAAGAVSHYPTSEEAAAAVVAWVQPGDLVLVKGSRGVKTDLVVDRIVAERG